VRAALSRTVPLVAAVVAAAPAAPVVPASATQLGERTLERGDRGDDVRQLQELLTGLDLPTDANGTFGADTVAHVKSYERREDLPVDGRVSPGQAHGMQRRNRDADDAVAPTDPAVNAPADPAPDTGTYPIDGPHTYGDGFGDRGGHKGEDIMADCGLPLRAVKDVTVRRVATEAAAGRYVVLHDGRSGEDYVYMHLSAVDVAVGDAPRAGDKVGEVGQTGDATACHLHFEEWTEPGWYAGGHAKDPLALLRSLGGS
jgi:murein DD-endopeptidase MepM/ murein hydrolase activator NlpD